MDGENDLETVCLELVRFNLIVDLNLAHFTRLNTRITLRIAKHTKQGLFLTNPVKYFLFGKSL